MALDATAPVKTGGPMLTVIVLAYNHETTIAAALDSVLAQKTSYPYQIWLCEDHSTDGTLEVCRRYAQRHPDRIRLIAQPTNTGVGHLRDALRQITTPYLAILDGDDSWCDEQKVQLALDTLEQHREYATFGHDTWYNDVRAKTRKSLVHEVHNAIAEQRFELLNAPYLHMSARIHRNVVDFQRLPAEVKIFDIHLFYLYLDQGPLFYEDRVMSIYNITGTGMWSKLADAKRRRNHVLAYFSLNALLGYRHDAFFTSKISSPALRGVKALLGKKLGWNVYVLAKYRTRLM
jgi:glycosyltransferase involved in cell wall biosynthesis